MANSDIGEVLRIINKELKRAHEQLRATEKERDELLRQLETKPLIAAFKQAASDDSNELSACLGGMCPSIDVVKRLRTELEETRRSLTEQLEESQRSCARLAAENQTLLEHGGPSLGEYEELLAQLDQRDTALRDSEEARERLLKSKEKWKAKFQRLRDEPKPENPNLNELCAQGARDDAEYQQDLDYPREESDVHVSNDPSEMEPAPATDDPPETLLDMLQRLPAVLLPTRPDSRVRDLICKGAFAPPQMPCFAACSPDGTLFFPGRTTYFAGYATVTYLDVNYQPHSDGQPVSWPKNSQFATLVGQTRELFYRRRTTVRYVGTYNVLTRLSVTEDECRKINNFKGKDIMAAAVDAALPKASRGDKDARHTVIKALRDGVAHYECLVLQYVDFNETLYQAIGKSEPQKRGKGAKSRKRQLQLHDGEVWDAPMPKRQQTETAHEM